MGGTSMAEVEVAASAAYDPYHDIKRLIEKELDQVQSLQSGLFSGQQDAIAAVSKALQSLEEQLSALELAVQHMVAEPSRYKLSTGNAFLRQVEVENLRYQYSGLNSSCQQVLERLHSFTANGNGVAKGQSKINGKGLVLHSSLPVSTMPDTEVGRLDQALQRQLAHQDNELEEISIHVSNVKHASEMIHDELEEQEHLLGGLDVEVTSADSRVRTLTQRTRDLLQRSSARCQMWTVVALVAVLMLLFVLALA